MITFLAQKSKRQNVQKADNLLAVLEKSSDPSMAPNHRHFNAVSNGWLSVDDVDGATQVLIRQVEAYVQKRNLDASSDAITIDKLARAYVKKGDLVKATMLVETLKKLKDDNDLPVGPKHLCYQFLRTQWKKSLHPEKGHFIRKLESAIVSLQEAEPKRRGFSF
jgi:hypothetical protein